MDQFAVVLITAFAAGTAVRLGGAALVKGTSLPVQNQYCVQETSKSQRNLNPVQPLAEGVSIVSAGVGFTGNSATKLPHFRVTDKSIKVSSSPVAHEDYKELVGTKVDLCIGAIQETTHLSLEQQALGKVNRVYDACEALRFYTHQLEKEAYTDHAFVVVSPRISHIKEKAVDLFTRATTIKFGNTLPVVERGNLKAGQFIGDSPELVIQELDQILENANSLLREYLFTRFEFGMVKVTGIGTFYHRILRPLVPLADGELVEEFHIDSIERPKRYSLPASEVQELLGLFEPEIQKVLLAYFKGEWHVGPQFKKNPFYIFTPPFKTVTSAIDALETVITFEPKDLQQFNQHAEAVFLNSPVDAGEFKYSLAPATSPPREPIESIQRPKQDKKSARLYPVPPPPPQAQAIQIVAIEPRIILRWSNSPLVVPVAPSQPLPLLEGPEGPARAEQLAQEGPNAQLGAEEGALGGVRDEGLPADHKRIRSEWDSSDESDGVGPSVKRSKK